MRFSFDFVLAGLIAGAALILGEQAVSHISIQNNLKSVSANDSAFAFNLGQTDYVLRDATGCIGEFTVKAKEDSVTVVLASGQIRIRQNSKTLNANTQAQFGFNPLRQLYEGHVTFTIESSPLASIKLKNVRPHEITIEADSLPNKIPIVFSVPGPFMIERRGANTMIIDPPSSLPISMLSPSPISTAIGALGFNFVALLPDQSERAICTTKSALSLDDIQAKLHALLPKGLVS